MEKTEYIDAFNKVIKDLNEWSSMRSEVERKIAEAKDALNELTVHGKEYLSVEERIEVARSWYWHTDLNAHIIASFLDVSVNYICKTVGSLSSGTYCECGNEYVYKSRQARQEFGGSKKFGIWRCRQCIEKSHKTFSEKQQKQEREKSAEIQRYKEMPYRLYLQTEHWKQTRKSALRRARYRCQLCSATKRLQVHHNTYDNIGEEQSQDLTVLCAECHQKHHDIPQRYRVPDEYSDIIIG